MPQHFELLAAVGEAMHEDDDAPGPSAVAHHLDSHSGLTVSACSWACMA
ncbi:MAG: hypothetical protein R2873_28730 [Caldilineaceae bacterium]